MQSKFEGRDYYEALGVARDAPVSSIQRAFRRLALRVHPDRAPADAKAKAAATRDFQVLAHMAEVLTDKSRRARYDATGPSGDDAMGPAEAAAVFRRVTKEDIDAYAQRYRGSNEQRRDVLEAFRRFKGDWARVLQWVPLAEPDDLSRFRQWQRQSTPAASDSAKAHRRRSKTPEPNPDASQRQRRSPRLTRNAATSRNASKDGRRSTRRTTGRDERKARSGTGDRRQRTDPDDDASVVSRYNDAAVGRAVDDGPESEERDDDHEEHEKDNERNAADSDEERRNRRLIRHQPAGQVVAHAGLSMAERARQRHMEMVANLEARFSSRKRGRATAEPTEEEFEAIQRRLDRHRAAKRKRDS